jgi:hypothetical protein
MLLDKLRPLRKVLRPRPVKKALFGKPVILAPLQAAPEGVRSPALSR